MSLKRESGVDHDHWALTATRFIESEKWRKEIKLDEILPDWTYPEKEKLSKYYVQFYHKTDKVRLHDSLMRRR